MKQFLCVILWPQLPQLFARIQLADTATDTDTRTQNATLNAAGIDSASNYYCFFCCCG